MLDKITNFIVEYIVGLSIVEQYLNIIEKTRLLYNRKFAHSVYINLANYTIDELRSVYG